MSNEMTEALQALAEDRGISIDKLFGIMANALESAYKRMPDSYEYAWVTIDPASFDIRVFAQELDEDGEPVGEEMDVTPDAFGRIAAQTTKQILTQGIREVEREMKYEEYAGREGDIVTGIVQQTDSRYTLLDLGRVEALLPQAEQVSMGPRSRGRQPGQGLHRRGPPHGEGSPDRGQPHPPRSDQAVVRARSSRDRRRHRRDQGLRPRTRAPDQDRGLVERSERRPGRCMCRRPGIPGPDGGQRAERREGRHHPVQRGSLRLRGQGAVAGQGQRGSDRLRHRHRRGHRARLPAVVGHRQGGPERSAGSPV